MDTRWGKAAAKHWKSSCLPSRTSVPRAQSPPTDGGQADADAADADSADSATRPA
ncbi:unnamed protein product, partial [Closterium sp. NIES-53]